MSVYKKKKRSPPSTLPLCSKCHVNRQQKDDKLCTGCATYRDLGLKTAKAHSATTSKRTK